MSKVDDYIAQESGKDPVFENLVKVEMKRLDFALQLANLRRSVGMTQKELAQAIGKPQSTISRVETGEMNPSIELIMEISAGLGKEFVPIFK